MSKRKKRTPPPRGNTAILYPERGALEDTALAYLSGGALETTLSGGYLPGISLVTP